MSTKVHLKDVRLTFPNLFEPKAAKVGQEPKFSASFLFAATHPAIAELKAAMIEAAKAKWGDKAQAIYDGLKAQDRLAVHDGAGKVEYAGYAGNLYINANNKLRPLVIGTQREPLVAADGKPYSGCYVNAIVEIWAQDHKEHGKRLNASLMGVQFLRDGERLSGGAVAAADDFEALPQAEAAAVAESPKGAAALF